MPRLKKITKKKLKEPDEFVSFTEEAFLFITRHSRRIVSGGIVLLIIVLSIVFYLRWEKKTEEEAYRKFSSALYLYQTVSSPYKEGSPSEYKSVLEKFDEVVGKFPKTSSGKISLLYQGNIHLRLDEFEEAVRSYQTFLQKAGKEKLYRTFAMEGLGYSYEGKKEYERAIQSFQKVLEEGEAFQLGDAHLNMGRCYEKMGRKKEALENYKAFLKVSQRSMMTNAILRKISILEN
jgi:tetratricopeptide (TPR) repeat protein